MLARILNGIAAWPVLGLVVLVFVLFVAQPWRSDQWHLRERDRAAPVGREAMLLPDPPSAAARAEAASPVVAPASTWEPYYDLRFRSSRFPTLWDGTPATLAEFHHLAVGDVTGDGRPEIVTIGKTEEPFLQLYVYPERSDVPEFPNGMLGPAMRYKLDLSVPVVGLAIADLNGDGVGDVIITSSDTVMLALSDGRGGLQVSTVASVVRDGGRMKVGVVVMDLDGDGSNDLVGHVERWYWGTTNLNTDRRDALRVWFGNGKGGISHYTDMAQFGTQEYGSGRVDSQQPLDMIADDFSNDGLLDVALVADRYRFAGDANARVVALYRNDGQGSLVESQVLSIEAETITSIDANQDGRRDLICVQSMDGPPGYVHPYVQGSQYGIMQPMVAGMFATSGRPTAPMGEDLDGDGLEDFVVAHDGARAFGVHFRRGGGYSQERIIQLRSATASFNKIEDNSLAVSDVNGDVCKDVVVAAGLDGLQVFMGTGCLLDRVTGGNRVRTRL